MAKKPSAFPSHETVFGYMVNSLPPSQYRSHYSLPHPGEGTAFRLPGEQPSALTITRHFSISHAKQLSTFSISSGKSHHVWQVWHHASHPNHTQPCSAMLPQTMVGTLYIWWQISRHNHLWHHNLTMISLWGHELSSELFLHTAQIKITILYYYAISLQKQYIVQM